MGELPKSHDAFPKTKALVPSKPGYGGKSITQTTRTVDSREYASNVYQEGGGEPINYGVSPADEREAQKAHDSFRDGLMQNVHGYRSRGPNQDDFIGKIGYNPARSEKQRRFFGAELGRAKAGEQTQTGMSTKKLKEFARKQRGGY